jgi:hypothetical protein
MLYFIFHRGPEWCAPPLMYGAHDICGVNWQRNHFSGNFWWSSCNYINRKQSKPLSTLTKNDRMKAESWLGNELPPPHVLCMHRSMKSSTKFVDHYGDVYPANFYLNAPLGLNCDK